jgi:hypothetical protein
MTSSARYKVLTLVTAFTGLLTFCVADAKLLLLLLGISVSLLSAWMVSQRPVVIFPRWALNTLVVLSAFYPLLAIAQLDQAISLLTDFLGIVLMLKMLDRRRMRDEMQMLGLSVFVMIGAVLTGAQLALGLTLLLYTPLAISCAVLWQVHAGLERQTDRQRLYLAAPDEPPAGVELPDADAPLERDRRARGSRRRLAAITAVAVALSLCSAIFAFVLIPRNLVQGGGAWGRPRVGATVGYAEEIRLGNAGLLSQSSEVVMDVTIRPWPEPPAGAPAPILPRLLYLRGAVLDRYDAQQGLWQRSGGQSLNLRAGENQDPQWRSVIRPGAPGLAEGEDARATPGPDETVRGKLLQIISLRSAPDTSQLPLFAVFRPVAVELAGSVGMGGPGLSAVETEPLTGILRRGSNLAPPGARLAYRVISDPLALEPTATSRPELVMQAGQAASAQVAQLALATASAALPDVSFSGGRPSRPLTADDIRAVVLALQAEIRSRCGYTLEMFAPARGQDPVEMFLFQTRQGHCEYFAAALATMCQVVGIEARIITGYVAGEYNEIAGQFTVRQSDAHAWVEVRMADRIWAAFDPTPPGGLMSSRRHNDGLLARIRQLYEALEFRWAESFVSFDAGTRGRLIGWTPDATDPDNLRAIGRRIREVRDGLRSRLPDGLAGQLLGTAMLSAVLIGGAYGLYRLTMLAVARWRIFAGGQSRRARVPAEVLRRTRFYDRMLLLLGRAGIAKPEQLPPLLHVRSLPDLDPETARHITALTDLYYRIRFQGADLPEAPAVAHGHLTALEARLRQAPPRPTPPISAAFPAAPAAAASDPSGGTSREPPSPPPSVR